MNHEKYKLIYEADNFSSEIKFEILSEAIHIGIQVLNDWAIDESMFWDLDSNTGCPKPTEKQIEDWDYMISTCSVSVFKWNEESKGYCDKCWSPSDEDKNNIDWLTWEELNKKYNFYYDEI